ncbi:MAG: diguanylate cyclase [Lachnospiraceae bacterium]|nr:diguanylate cyclase [Lachnospiraceae bacterium]
MEKTKHILIVDDVTTNLKLAAEVLQGHYKLSMAKSGEQAIQFLQKVKPDLILLDIRMPEMDGYQTLEIIKANPATANIPVVFLTVDDQRESEIKGLKMGAMDFILKPFEPGVMLSRIDKILQIEDLRKNLSISARKDVLTGLWNRKQLEDEVERYLDETGQKAVFIIMDIDNFKQVNDTYGHIMGDAVLECAGKILKNSVGPRDIAARIGGDEFAVFLKGDYSEEEIVEYCEMIIHQLEEDIADVINNKDIVTVSMGIAQVPVDGYDYLSLYTKADKALYFVKQNGKNDFHFFYQREEKEEEEVSETENKNVDMEKLEQFVAERNEAEGAYRVEYEGFKHIYHFVSRGIGRTGQTVQMALFTLNYIKSMGVTPEILHKAMKELERAIIVSLRQGDVTTQYSSFQYVVLLMSASEENAEKVVQRILDTWEEMNEYEGIQLDYAIKQVEARNN